MPNDPAFLFYPGDYLRDTQCLSEKAQVAYDRIMCEHMRNICIRQDQINFFTKRLSVEEKNELYGLLKKIDGGYQIQWVAESISKRKAYTESRRKNRSSKPKNISSTYVRHMENENEIVNEDVITKEIEKFLLPEMLEIFKSSNPKYKENKQRDFPSLLSIAEFLAEHGKLNGSIQENKSAILIAWDPLCKIISGDKWFQTKPLSVISKMIQEVTQIALHGKTNGKQNYGSKERAEELNGLLAKRYGNGGSATG